MDSEVIQNAIRNPTPEAASEIMSNITPDFVSDIMPSVYGYIVDGTEPSEVMAEQTVNEILNVVETQFLGESVDFAIENFGQRIIDMLTGETMLSIFERVAMMVVNGTA
jgi:hypothetical protein